MNRHYWWQSTSIYHIYPRSFADSNNDGIGDIPGIIAKLDYIQELGFETVWLSPHYVSPQRDFGYDVADFRNVAPEYGTFADVDRLIMEVHKRRMKVVFDMILNHTSDEHPWFVESRSSKVNPKRDWYIWRDGTNNLLQQPPNNWKAIPGGSAWKYDELTKQYYFHNFLSFQPDLNFRNPQVKAEMLDILRFWLDKGVDGFRLDIFHSIYKDEQFRDNPFSWRLAPIANQKEGYFQKLQYNLNRPETFQFAKEIRSLLDEYDNCNDHPSSSSSSRFAIGEVFGEENIIQQYLGDDDDDEANHTNDNNNGLNLILLFDLIHLNNNNNNNYAETIRNIIIKRERLYPPPRKVPTFCLGNHDRRRYIDRIGGNIELAKLLAFFIYTVRCVPINYYGDELAMPDGDFDFHDALDGLTKPYAWIPKWILKKLDIYINRDGCRTPMQWNSSNKNAGFCSQAATKPWLPVHPDFRKCNVEDQSKDPHSVLNVHKQLLHLRQKKECLKRGELALIDKTELPPDVVAYDRIFMKDDIDGDEGKRKEQVRVFMNFSPKQCAIAFPQCFTSVLAASVSGPDRLVEGNELKLKPWSAAVLG